MFKKIHKTFKEPECAGNGIVGIAKNGVPIYNSVGGDCCDLALKVSNNSYSKCRKFSINFGTLKFRIWFSGLYYLVECGLSI